MLILAASLAIFVYGMTAAMLGTILPDFSARFHLTPKQNGTIAFCQAMGLILASIAVGPLIDYEGKKLGLVLGLSLSALAVALLPRSNGFRAIASHLFLLGTGGGIIVTAANALGQRCRPGASRNGSESSEYFLRSRRLCHAIRIRQSARQELHAALSSDRRAGRGGGRGQSVRSHSASHQRSKLPVLRHR